MTIDDAIADLTERIKSASPDAVVRVKRRSDEEGAIKEATQEITLSLLTNEGLDVQVLVYDIATSLPPSE